MFEPSLMNNPFDYIQKHYKVPANVGTEVSFNGRLGVIVGAAGQYVQVNFYDDKNTSFYPVHPKDLVYGGKGKIRSLTAGQRRYREYCEVRDCFDSFIDFLRYRAHHIKMGTYSY